MLRMNSMTTFWGFCIFIVVSVYCDDNGTTVYVQTFVGNVKGKVVEVGGRMYNVFLGIPYAQPPVKELRFKPPLSVDTKYAWDTIDASNGFKKMCIQNYYLFSAQSEDCLYLNIMSPELKDDDKKLAVMVWIHGGGFIAGSANDYPMEGTLRNIVFQDVVFVSFNYRLGPFGFFTTESSIAPGNYGLLDQVEALKWVRKNIKAFGGDPTKITVFGENTGAASVSLLTLSPLAKGLFNGAIMMSGSALANWLLMDDNDPTDRSAILSQSLDCRETAINDYIPACPYNSADAFPQIDEFSLKMHEAELKCLQSKGLDEIVFLNAELGLEWGPRIDGLFLPEPPENLMNKRYPLNITIGVTKDEYAIFTLQPGVNVVLNEQDFYTNSEFTDVYVNCKNFQYPDVVNFTARYHYGSSPKLKTDGTDDKHFWFQQDVKMKSSLLFWTPAFREAVYAVNSKSTVYMYSWDWPDAMDFHDKENDFYYNGAVHSSELRSLFDFNRPTADLNHSVVQRKESHNQKMKQVLGKLWTNFAKFRNPTPPGRSIDSISWEPFSTKDANYLSINYLPRSRMKNNFYADDIEFWTKFIPSLEKSVNCQ